MLQAMQSRILHFASANVAAAPAPRQFTEPSPTASGATEAPSALKDAITAISKQDYTTALKLLRPLADQGDADAQSNLGHMYAHGQGVTNDDAEAVKWYRKAADQGNAEAQNNLGVMYQEGRGVAKSDTEALKWYREAAEQGNAEGEFDLGVTYQEGRGVDKNDAEALKWYRKAADQGFKPAKAILAQLVAASASTNPISSPTPSSSNSISVVVTRDYIVTATVCPGCSGGPITTNKFISVRFRYGSLSGKAYCTQMGDSAGPSDGISINIDIGEGDCYRFFNSDNLSAILDPIKNAVYQECLQGSRSRQLTDVINRPVTRVADYVTINGGLDGHSTGLNGPWVITANGCKYREDLRLAQVQAQLQYALQQQQIAQQKQALRAKVWSDLGIQQWVEIRELAANPYRYQGKVVGIRATFSGMLSEHEAMFVFGGDWIGGGIAFTATSVPSTLFQGNEALILGIKVAGIKAIKTTTGGEANLPTGEYVGSYRCVQAGCAEYFDQ